MSQLEFLFQLLLETLNGAECRYYQGDEEPCLKYNADDGSSFPACNCDGKILQCDLFDFVDRNNLWKYIVKPEHNS